MSPEERAKLHKIREKLNEMKAAQNENLKWPRKITVVRHGESKQNVALDILQDNIDEVLLTRKKTRDADIELTEKGIWQAQKTGELLAKEEPYETCFVSPYKRTLHTCDEITSQLPYELTVYPDFRIREKEFGLLHGYTTKEIKEQYPEEYEHRERDGKFYYRLPRGENYLDVSNRLYSFLGKLNRDYAGKNVLIVTHHVPYVMFRAIFEHLLEEEILALPSPPNCAIEQFEINRNEFEEGRLVLTEYNKVAY